MCDLENEFRPLSSSLLPLRTVGQHVKNAGRQPRTGYLLFVELGGEEQSV